jgi:molecular chaperone IbpA
LLNGGYVVRQFDLTPLFRSSIGFDHMMQLIDSAMSTNDSSSAYPPYNIEKLNDDTYRIVMAVAGFGDKDLSVVVQDNSLIIEGKAQSQEGEIEYLYRGIAGRAFERHFQLADFIKIGEAKLENGLLSIDLQREIPEAKKPRNIKIQAAGALNTLIEQK